jgi:hypothetical protein
VGSQRDLHLLCSVAQLALHRRHLHSCLRSGVGYRQANRKQSAHMRRDTWSFRQKASKKKIGADYLGWVTERIFIHHIAGCEDSGGWSQSINTSMESACGDFEANSIWPKVYNLHKTFPRLV